MAFFAQIQIQIYCFLFSYVVALVCEVALLHWKSAVVTRWILFGFSGAGFFAHTAYLITRSRVAGLPPLLSSQQDWLLVLAWIGSLLYLVLLMTHRQLAHGLFMLPAILLLVVVAIFASRQATGQSGPTGSATTGNVPCRVTGAGNCGSRAVRQFPA